MSQRTERANSNTSAFIKYFPCLLIIGTVFTFSIAFDSTMYAISDVDGPSAEWEMISLPGYEDTWFWDIEFVNSTHGWLVGGWLSNEGVLLHTSNEGNTWSVQLELSRGSSCIETIGEYEIWFVTNTKLYHSTDGGGSWNESFTGLDSMKQVDFFNSTFGFVGGNDGFAVTEDGGLTWSRVNNPLDDTTFTYPSDLSITPQQLRVSSHDGIFKSTDLGLTWTQEVDVTTDAFCFLNETLGWAAHGYTISDFNGNEWNEHEFFGPLTNTRSRNYNDIEFIDEKHGWIVGTGPSISYTRDGGLSWYEQVLEDSYLLSISVINASHCWVAGADGALARTTNGDGLGPKQLVGYRVSSWFGSSWRLTPYFPTLIASVTTLGFVLALFYYRRVLKKSHYTGTQASESGI